MEQNIIKIEKNTLKNAAFSFWKEGVPAIGGAYVDGGLAKMAKVSGETLLKLLVESLSKKIEERKLPEISYALKISKSLE